MRTPHQPNDGRSVGQDRFAGIVAAARRMYSEWEESRQAKATRLALRFLNARMMRDLGVERSVILSIADRVSSITSTSSTTTKDRT